MTLFGRHHVGEFHAFTRSGKRGDGFVGEFDEAVSHGVKGVVVALFDVQAGANFRTALANDDIADFGMFSGVEFGPEALALRIAS